MSDFGRQIEDEESSLAGQLKRLCYTNGKEFNPSLSAKILHKLGLVYKRKGPDKICLIQSAALLNSAIVRAPDNVDEIKEDLIQLCSDVLRTANAGNNRFDLIDAALSVKNMLLAMRRKASEDLDKVTPIPEGLDGNELLRLEKQKIKDVNAIQERITESYKTAMGFISKCCTDAMGEPPCKFALVGMGSLARREITPYSDFEHIILLEEGVQDQDNYGEVLEYFRWYATNFLVIMVNLQETILRFLAIPCLNGVSENWYFDAYTRCGVSPDGFSPSSCKNALGRLRKTQKKPWITELVKPVSQMLEYLHSEENLKNGYRLASVLTKVCFVSGDEATFKQFCSGVDAELESEELQRQFRSQMTNDLKNFDTFSNLTTLTEHERMNIKEIVYRGTTKYISFLGRLHNVKAQSCCDTVTELARLGLITDEYEHVLKYAVAIACEMRLKVYSEKGAQDDWVDDKETTDNETRELIASVGEASMIDYFSITLGMQRDMQLYLRGNQEPDKLVGSPLHFNSFCSNRRSLLLRLYICYRLKFYKKFAQLAEPQLELFENDMEKRTKERDTYKFYLHYLGIVYGHLKQTSKAMCLFSKELVLVERLYLSTRGGNDVAISKFTIADCFVQMQKNEEALENYRSAMKLWIMESQLEPASQQRPIALAVCRFAVCTCLINLQRYEEALGELERTLDELKRWSPNEYTDKDVGLTLNNYALCLMNSNRYDEALQHFEKALLILKKISPDENSDFIVSQILSNMGLCLQEEARFGEALELFEKSLMIRRRLSRDESADKSVAEVIHSIGVCHNIMRNYDEALPYLQESLGMWQRVPDGDNHITASYLSDLGFSLAKMARYGAAEDKIMQALSILSSSEHRPDSCAAFAHATLGICMLNTNRSDEGIKTYKTSIKLQKSRPRPHNVSIADCIQNMGICLKNMGWYDEALEKYDESLDIRRKLPKDAHTFTDIIDYSSNRAVCLMHLAKFEEALETYEEILAMRRGISENEFADDEVAIACNNVALCFMRMNQYEDAMREFSLALEIRKNSSIDHSADKTFAKMHSNMGLCLITLNRFQEALQHCLTSLDMLTAMDEVGSEIAICYLNAGMCWKNFKAYDEAVEAIGKSLAIRQQTSPHPQIDEGIASCHHNLGICLCNANRYMEAKQHFQFLLDLIRLTTDRKSKREADCLGNIAICFEALKRYDEALSMHKQALSVCRNIDSSHLQFSIGHIYNIGLCLFNLGRYEEALKPLKLVFHVAVQGSKNPAIDGSVLSVRDKIKNCFEELDWDVTEHRCTPVWCSSQFFRK